MPLSQGAVWAGPAGLKWHRHCVVGQQCESGLQRDQPWLLAVWLLLSAQSSSHLSLYHISPSCMRYPWFSQYTGSSFAHILPVWCTTHGSWWESVLYLCRSRKRLAWKLQSVSGYKFEGEVSQGSSLDLNEITCDRCSLEFFPKIWLTAI